MRPLLRKDPMIEPVEFYSRGVRISGVVHIPDRLPAQVRRPAVVMSHGMANNRDEADQHSYLGARLEAAGYVTLRFDFRGCGASGSRGQMFIGTEWPQDLRAALTYLETRPEVDPERIAAIGSSWGGGVTIYTAAYDRRIRCAVSLAAPASGERWLETQWTAQHGKAGWERFLGEVAADRRRVLAGEPSRTVRLIGGFIPVDEAQIPYLDQFLAEHPYIVADVPLEIADDILQFCPEQVVARVAPAPLLIIQGTRDPLVDTGEALAYYERAGEGKELFLVEGGIHQLLSGETAAPVGDRILKWLHEHLDASERRTDGQ